MIHGPRRGHGRRALLAGAAALPLLAAPALASPASYSLLTTIGVPVSASNSVGGDFTTYDISYFDPSTQLDYVADRSNATVDIFSAATNSAVGSIGGTGQLFSGQTSSNNTSGPDGVQVVNLAGQHQVYAGNGNSTLLGFNVAAGNAQFATVATGAPSQNRVDEMAFDPVTKTLLAANNAAPGAPFATLFQTSAGSAVPTVLKTLAQVSGADKA